MQTPRLATTKTNTEIKTEAGVPDAALNNTFGASLPSLAEVGARAPADEAISAESEGAVALTQAAVAPPGLLPRPIKDSEVAYAGAVPTISFATAERTSMPTSSCQRLLPMPFALARSLCYSFALESPFSFFF